MKLSEAIRKGSEGTQQITDLYLLRDEDGLHCCALGAAWHGCFPNGVFAPGAIYRDIIACTGTDLYQVVETRLDAYGDDIEMTLAQRIVVMNDEQHKTREEIADWLEGQGL